ncbi:MAG: hypothetical protein H6Q00_50 [Holophagaceae bacterium]|nr:hypothetical protein [Holophagaceae bacterium]
MDYDSLRLAFHPAVLRGSPAEELLLGTLSKFIRSVPRPGEVALVVNHPDEIFLSLEFRLIPGPETDIAQRTRDLRDFIHLELAPLKAGVYTLPAEAMCPKVIHELQ